MNNKQQTVMKQTLIKITDDHYVVVDDSEIKFGDWFLTDDKRIEQSAPDWNAMEWHRKITYSTQPLEWYEDDSRQGWLWDKIKVLNLSEVKELIGEVDVEKKAREEHEQALKRDGSEYAAGYYEGLIDKTEWEVTFDKQGKLRLV